MAGYTSRILLTFTIPFFGFVLWFLKKKKESKSVLNTGIQVEESTSPVLFQRQNFEIDVDSSVYTNQGNSCKDNSVMQLKETQTIESQSSTCVSQQNGISQSSVQHNGLSQDCVQENGTSQDNVQQISSAHCCAQQPNDTQNVLLNDVPETNIRQNGISDKDTQNISKDSVQNIFESDIREKNVLSKCVQQNGVSGKSLLQNGKQNGISRGKKKKSKGREKSSTCSTDIIDTNEKLHLEDEIRLVEQFGVIDISVSTKNEILNAINKNGMDKISDTNCDSQSSSCVNGNSNLQTGLSIVKSEASAKEKVNDVHKTDERNSIETGLSRTEIHSEQSNTESCTSLILPVDFASSVQTNGDMMESPGASYCDSLGSSDSGRGASEIHLSPTQESATLISYAFEIPQKYVGLLIGKQGKNVNLIKQKTNADILIKRHPTSSQNKICLISGTEDEINAALRKIREKFPPERYPNVTLSQICFLPFMPCPENLMLRLPEGSSFDVMLSATVTAGHFFLQQPTHPTFHSLIGLTYQMTEMYNLDLTAPPLPHMEKGFICAANLANCWYRAEIDEVFYESDECRVKFLDYGGYSILPRAALRQINYQFMNVPFQASECYLGLVTLPEGKTEWSPQATAYFEELAQGQILQGFITAYAENGVPYVQLYKITGVEHVDINMALVQKGHAKYIKQQQPMA